MSTVDERKKKRTMLRIGPGTAGIRMTGAEFDAITDYDDLYRYELVRGVLVVSPLARPSESAATEYLGHCFRCYRAEHPLGPIMDATLAVQYVATQETRRLADRLFWCGLGRLPDVNADRPTVAIDFITKARRHFPREYDIRRSEYGSLGIPEYWLFDRFLRVVTIFRPDGTTTVVKEGEMLRSPQLPGFELDLKPLFGLTEGWDKPKR